MKAGAMPTPELLREMGAFNEQLVNAGATSHPASSSKSHPGTSGVSVRRWAAAV